MACPRSDTVGIAAAAADKSGPEWRHTSIGSSCSVGRSEAIAGMDFHAVAAV